MSQPDFSSSPRAPRLPVAQKAALVAALAALALAGLLAWSARRDADVARARLAGVRAEVQKLAARERALVAAGAESGSVPSASFPPARIVAAVADALPPDARLQRLSIEYAREVRLELQVEARDASAWDALLERFFGSPAFRDVEAGPESRAGEVRSVVRARWSEASP